MLRVLQVVNIMDRAGLETMLMNYYRCIDRDKIQFDFLTHRDFRADYDDEIISLGGKAGSALGTGGMATKIKAAQIAAEVGCDTVIANGADSSILYAIVEGEEIGTRFLGKQR